MKATVTHNYRYTHRLSSLKKEERKQSTQNATLNADVATTFAGWRDGKTK